MNTSDIHDMVRSGELTPEEGARFYEARREIVWMRKPWWVRLLLRLVWGPYAKDMT